MKSKRNVLASLKRLLLVSALMLPTISSQAKEVDLFVSGGQSNANYSKKSFGVGIENVVTQSSAFSNAEVVKTAMGGTPLVKWMDDDGNPQIFYHKHFFNHSGEGNPGQLEQRIQEIKERGDTVRFRGFFWFQGEADANGEAGVDDNGGSEKKYKARFNLLLKQMAKDVGHDDWNFVLNTVGKTRKGASNKGINAVLAEIANTNPKGVLHDTQVGPQRTGKGVHSYNHILVGENNARLFIKSFVPSAVWEVVSQDDWAKATSALKELSLKEGVISGEGTFSSVVKKLDKAQKLKSLTITQTLNWNNWEEVDQVGPNIGDAPVFLPLGKGDYWMFGRKGKPGPNLTIAAGGKNPKGGGYHAYHSKDMKNWVHHGCVTDFKGKMMTTAEHKDGVFYFYSDIPNDTDPHLYLDDDIYDGINGEPMGLVYEDGPGSDMAIIRDLDDKFHLISENWEPIDAMRFSCDSPLANHAVSPDGIQPFVESKEPAVDYRTTPTGETSTYKHPHWGENSVVAYQVHEPEQEAFGDWTIVRVGDDYHLFGDWEVVDAKNRTDIGIVAHDLTRKSRRTVIAAHLTASKVSGPYTLRDGIDTYKHPDPTVGFAEGQFYLITQGKDFISSGPWNEGVSARAGVDSDGDGTIDQWTQWQEVSESYDHTPGYARVIQKTPASIDLSSLPAAQAVKFEFKLAGEENAFPQIDKVVIE